MSFRQKVVPDSNRWVFALGWVGLWLSMACRATDSVDTDTTRAGAIEHQTEIPSVDEPGPVPDENLAQSAVDQSPPADPVESDATRAFQELLTGMGIRYVESGPAIEVDGWVNMDQGLVEVFACTPEGKTHEAVVVLDCLPSGLHAGLLALGLEPGGPVEFGTDGAYQPPHGDEVQITVRWFGVDGSAHAARAEDWIWNHQAQRSMERCGWIFAGSFMQPDPNQSDRGTYAANYIKSLVTTYHDASSVLENPHQLGVDDTIYYSNQQSVPAVGTPVTVSFTIAE